MNNPTVTLTYDDGSQMSSSQIQVTFLDHMGDDNTVVDAARVSFDKHSGCYTAEQNRRLITHLGKHGHISPFGHCFASFRVKAPVFVARQLVKHKFLRWNEISRRYVDSEPEFYVPDTWRGRSEDKKQGSSGEVDVRGFTLQFAVIGENTIPHAEGRFNRHALSFYEDLLEHGVAPEQARMVLPQSTMTEWVWSGSLDAFASMCNLRCKEDTQYESRVVADKIDERMRDLFPLSWEALRETDK